jgi:hypothetical protein
MKNTKLLFITGILMMVLALSLNRVDNVPDFWKGVLYGIGLGLLILFVRKRKATT